MSTPTTEPPTTATSPTETKPQAQPPVLSYAARAKQSLPPSAISADLPTPISTPGKSINEPSPPNTATSTSSKKASSRASRSSRPERPSNPSSGKNAASGRNPHAKLGSAKHHGGGGGESKEHKARSSAAHASKEGGASKAALAVEGATDTERQTAASIAPVDETATVPPPAPKPAPLPLVNIWKTRADAVKPSEKEAGHKSKKNHSHFSSVAKTTTAPSTDEASSPAPVDPSHPSFPSLADAPAPSSKRSSSRPRPSILSNGEREATRGGNASAGEAGDEGAAGTSADGGKLGKKEKKTKWVAIPPSELQISVDLASDRSKKNRTRRGLEDSSAAPASRAAKKKAAASSATHPTSANPSAPTKKAVSSKKNDTADARSAPQGSTQAVTPSADVGGKKVAGTVGGAVADGEVDPLASLAASMPTPSRQAHQLPLLAGVSLGIEGMMRKDEEVVEISSDVERSLLRSAADARTDNPNLFSPPSPDILPFDLQPPPLLSSASSATGDASSSTFRSGTQPSSIASEFDASSKPLHTPAPKIQVRITAPPPDYVPTKPPAGSSSRSSRGAYSSRGRSAPRGGLGGPSFPDRSNPFAAPYYQMQQQAHTGGPLPVGAASYHTSPSPLSNGGPHSPSQPTFSPPLPSSALNGVFPPSSNPQHALANGSGLSSGAGSFVPASAGRRPSQTSALAVNGQSAPKSNSHHFSHAPPPMPTPVTIPNSPLDPLRFYLLGQLEYYFGVQNLAMDFFLRQQMDSQGYVSIPLVATFNRIKNLTTDLTLVREMLGLSQLVEVKGDKVRLANLGWAQWVLPGATEAVYELKMPEQEEKPVAVEEEKSVVEETQDEKDEREVEEATLSI